MTALVILGSTAAFIAAVLLIPASVTLHYDGLFTVKVRVWFIRLRVYPAKNGRQAEEKGKPAKQKKEKQTILERARVAIALLKTFFLRFDRLVSHFVISPLCVQIRAAGENAHQTALLCGELSALVFPALKFLESRVKRIQPDICIFPDFALEKTQCKIHSTLRVMPLFVLIAVLGGLVAYVRASAKGRLVQAPKEARVKETKQETI